MSSKTIAFANEKTETFFERHAWKVLLFFGLFMTLIGLPDLLTGGSCYEGGGASTLQGITGLTWKQPAQTQPP